MLLRRALSTALSLSLAPLLAGCGASGAGGDAPLGEAQEASVCAAGTTVKGVDVSVYQGTVNWPDVKAAGNDFAIARISDGSYLDTDFTKNWAGIKSAGMVRGAYQFFEPGEDPVTQANIVIGAAVALVPLTAASAAALASNANTASGDKGSGLAGLGAGGGVRGGAGEAGEAAGRAGVGVGDVETTLSAASI